jgi:HD superfamily phosphohydrolase
MSDSEPELSAETLRILQQVMQEQQEQQERFEQLRQQAEERFDEAQEADSDNKAEKDLSKITMDFFREDWQLSQFWYDENTSEQLAREVLENTDKDSLVCCISSPTAYVKLMVSKYIYTLGEKRSQEGGRPGSKRAWKGRRKTRCF